VAIPTMIELPGDLAAHRPEVAEIWYLTGALECGERSFGAQAMFTTSPSGWAFTSCSLTDVADGAERHGSSRRRVEDIVLRTDSLEIDAGELRLRGDAEALHFSCSFDRVRVDLQLTPGFPVLYSCVAGTFPYFGGPTWQFAFPGMRGSGDIEIDGRSERATGELWLDRQWSASRSAFGTAHGFTWFGIWLDDGSALSVWDTTAADGSGAGWATLVAADGTHSVATVIPLAASTSGEQRTPAELSGVQPAEWIIDAPGLGARLVVSHRLIHEEHRFYCGLCEVGGTIGGRTVSGRGVVDTVPGDG
jgi:predicted secreted hydrolase